MPADPATLDALDKLLARISGYANPRQASEEWKQAYRLLQKTSLDTGRVSCAVGMRDAAGLGQLIEELRNPPAPPPAVEPPSPEICDAAFKAFRKRMLLTMLDDESRVGRNPLSKGAKSEVAGILPPSEWPELVWKELARQGRLRDIGKGFYQLVEA